MPRFISTLGPSSNIRNSTSMMFIYLAFFVMNFPFQHFSPKSFCFVHIRLLVWLHLFSPDMLVEFSFVVLKSSVLYVLFLESPVLYVLLFVIFSVFLLSPVLSLRVLFFVLVVLLFLLRPNIFSYFVLEYSLVTIKTTALLRLARILSRVLEAWGNLLSLKLQTKTISLHWWGKLSRSKMIKQESYRKVSK